MDAGEYDTNTLLIVRLSVPLRTRPRLTTSYYRATFRPFLTVYTNPSPPSPRRTPSLPPTLRTPCATMATWSTWTPSGVGYGASTSHLGNRHNQSGLDLPPGWRSAGTLWVLLEMGTWNLLGCSRTGHREQPLSTRQAVRLQPAPPWTCP